VKIQPLFRVLSGFLSSSKTNANAQRIEDAFENTLSRDGSSPNAMQAELDMGLNRVMNVGEPTDLNDAVRLQDLQDIVAGDFTVSADWDDVTGKPEEFPPEAHVHVAADVTGLEEFVEDTVASVLVAGTGVTISHNDGANTITIDATAPSSADWNTLVNKPATFPATAHTHAEADVTGLTAALAGKANTAHTHLLADITDYAASSGSTTLPNFVDVFGGLGDGVFNNDTAFTNAEASTYERIWLPPGNYWTTKTNAFFTKWYEGPGKIYIVSGAGVLTGKKQTAVSTLSFGASVAAGDSGGTEYGEKGDMKFTNAQYQYTQPGSREHIDQAIDLTNNGPYYQAGAYPEFQRYFVRSGSSGTNAHLVAAANATATQADIFAADGLTIGDTIAFQVNDNHAPGKDINGNALAGGTDIVTITNIQAGAGTGGSDRITFTPALKNTYPFAGSDWRVPAFLAGAAYANGISQISKGRRTFHAQKFITVDSTAGGDVYGIMARVSSSYVLKSGQTHWFDGNTVGQYGGDTQLTSDGQYGQVYEGRIDDNGHNVSAIGWVTTYNRTNDTFSTVNPHLSRWVTWIHDLPKNEGSKPIDVFYYPNGLARVGIDFTAANFSSDGERAIQMKTGQRIYFDASATAAGSGQIPVRARGFWGDIQGDTYITHSTDSTEVLDTYVGGVRSFRIRPAAVSTPHAFSSGSTIAATSNIVSNSGYIYGGTGVRVPTGQALYLDGLGSNTYLTFDGGTVRLFKLGVQVASW
jgi:hypothetical protein